MIPKFRAWHSKTNCMYDVKSIDYTQQVVYFGNGLLIPYSFSDVEVVQGTGDRDMNGKEIFEGDIIEFDDTIMYEDYSCGETNEVIGGETSVKNLAALYKGSLVWCLEDYKHGGHESEEYVSMIRDCLDDKDIELSKFLSRPSNFKIVGNFYQIKYLLEEST